MATMKFLLVLFFSATAFASGSGDKPEQSLSELWNHTHNHIERAKQHINHMLSLALNAEAQQKVADSVKKACDNLAAELETHGNELQNKADGQHNEALKNAANNAANSFKSSSQSLKGVNASDIKAMNLKYFEAAECVLAETKKMIDAKPCDKIEPLVKEALNKLHSDCHNYEREFHNAVGSHAPAAGGEAGHQAHGDRSSHSAESSSQENAHHHHH